MAVILLQAAGAAIGGLFGPFGAALGQAAGALAGSLIDESLISATRTVRGKALTGARIPGADEGEPVARVHGTARIAGTLIWATRFEESVVTERSGGKATGPKVERRLYYGNFALGLCEGPVAAIRRVWADGRELDLSAVTMRIHRGEADQLPDPLIEAKQGAGAVPAWRGLAYVVFERLPLEDFGNRIPVLQFEVLRPVGELESRIEAVAVIPGATEHGYAPGPVHELPRAGEKRYLNRNSRQGDSDWTVSLDELQALCPNLKSVALVSAWMGTDLRAGHCRFEPCVEVADRKEESRAWKVGGRVRATARRVSADQRGPLLGGTPDDAAVIEAIRDLRARGLKVVLYPFVLMDVAAGNGLPDPHGAAEQPAFPWRGRLTVDPAPGRPGSPDGTAACRAAVAALCGTATPADIAVGSGRVDWTGGDDGYRRMILHHAGLALAAGGVDGFVIGSEMKGLTRLRDETGAFPFVEALCALAADVAGMLGPATTVTYAADWSEYAGLRAEDGSGDVVFNLDPLWAHPAVGAVGIDNYMPLSDWRDGDAGAGNPDGARHACDRAALKAAIRSGEGYDWFYAGEEDRAARRRTPIADGLSGKDWVYRVKDIRGWWQNLHYDRSGGVEAAEPTAWVPAMKPVWLTELGCPAVDKGPAAPNVFPDPRSAEGGLPPFSTGARDDDAQRAFLSAHLGHWQGAANADGMVETAHIHLWAWDARPFPAFPALADIWSDGGNWRTGHWLNGRLGMVALADLIAAVLTEAGFHRFDVSGVRGAVAGHVVSGIASPRAVLEPLLDAFAIDMREGAGGLEFASRLAAAAPAADIAVVADPEEGARFEEVRGEAAELPGEAILAFFDPARDHERASARSRRLGEGTLRQAELAAPVALDAGLAAMTADQWLADRWAARRRISFALPQNRIAPEPGDTVRLVFDNAPAGRFRIIRIEDGAVRRVEAVGHATAVNREPAAVSLARPAGDAAHGFAPELVLADLPLLSGTDEGAFAVAAALARPWRPVAVSSSPGAEGYRSRVVLDRPARLGRLAQALPPGRIEGRIDAGGRIEVALDFGGLESISRQALEEAATRAAIPPDNGVYEIVQFERATETAPGLWTLSGLLRGQAGTDDAMRAGASPGARFVMLDDAVKSLGLSAGEAGLDRNYVAEPLGLSAEGAGAALAFAGGLRARTPLSPVHVTARREAAGIRLAWIRRGRLAADGWTAADIPLGEEAERYRLELLAGGSVVRAAETQIPEWLYPAALELADFGAPVDRLDLRVSQGGLHVPWGTPRPVTLSL